MIIIVEGIDRVGKTTLCNMLSKEFGINIFKNQSFYGLCISKETEIELINQLINFVNCVNCDIIFDRLHLTEFVYGLCNRNYANTDIVKIDKKLSEMNCLLIYVKPTDIDESSKQHGSDLRSHDTCFEAIFKNSKIKKFSCDYNSLDSAVEFVRNNIKEYSYVKDL